MKKKLLNVLAIASLLLTNILLAQTPGTLTVVYTPTVPSGATFYSGTRNLGAAWIETSTGTFVKTKIKFCGGECTHLTATSTGACSGCAISPWQTASAGNTTGADVASGATKTTFAATSFTWNGTDVSNTVVADGSYNFKVYSVWNHGTTASNVCTSTIGFTKGTTAYTITPTATTCLKNITIIWHPANTTDVSEAFVNAPGATIYPNPSNGVFTVDFKNATSIKVLNTLGSVIYETKIEDMNEGSKTIDLSAFASGIYFVNISNGTYSSNKRITLDK